ncbi:MAG: ribokinase [Anaerolineae bacterium]
MSQGRVVVVGSSNTDMIVQADRLPRPGETVLGGDLVMAAGGKGANQAVAAARLGAQVAFVARVGNDMFGAEAIERFRREGLDVSHVVRDPEAPSGVALIVVEPGGQNIIAVAPGANARLSPDDVAAAREVFVGAGVVLLQLEVPVETVLAAAQAGRQAGARVILNPAPAPSGPLPDEIWASVDIVTPNETEAAALTGADAPEDAARALLARGVGIVIVTLGAEGALVATRDGMQRMPGFPVQAVDATAAGDAFNGALAVALARGDDLDVAVRYAHAVAAISVTRLGAQPSLPTAAEVEAFLRERG